ncbi:MAG: SpoIIE family protein phosphatase [Eubacterium sp.]|nr:SpoIIE family protein phosphatase [Eubacterium sp.]MCM1216662.1 SpoIIE family protein phosphatase [Lachnospiraceae bacterium]MCM1303136.1 SpoIIE family protein phosphatase [Butyrivibrio sp.]MCM1342805.1 SpoIIE family protein phosphatase [Muribaculaceae bacterium]MCM1240414.1 SpoIIE family protein phosphatase [Lachnospiraceae bacterium]
MMTGQELIGHYRGKKTADRRLREEELRRLQVSDLCRRKLLNYADTFNELSRSYGGEFQPIWTDRQRLLSEKRLWENRQIIGEHLAEMAKIMTEVASEVICFYPMEERKKRMLTTALKEEGIRVEDPGYLPRTMGKQAVSLTLSTEIKGGILAEEAADMVSVLLDRRLQLSAASPCRIERQPRSFFLEEEAGFQVLTGFSRATKENETISGDNFAVMEAEKGRITVMLSDGTGSGEKAGKDSERVLDLMEKMIEAGYSIDGAVNLVNTALFVTGEDRNHPTLDICDIDLYQGNCRLYKAGGAATFLKREEKVEQLKAGTLPLGIFQQVDIPSVERLLQDGDYLIMVSDGVIDALQGHDYENTLEEAISGIREQNPGEIADKILRMVICAGGGHILDDMTVGVIGVWENNALPS